MSTQNKSKSKVHEEEIEAHAEDSLSGTIEDNYEPQVEAVGRSDFENTLYGHVVAEFVVWADSRFTNMTVNMYRLEPVGMAMTQYKPILIGSYPISNRKH